MTEHTPPTDEELVRWDHQMSGEIGIRINRLITDVRHLRDINAGLCVEVGDMVEIQKERDALLRECIEPVSWIGKGELVAKIRAVLGDE